MSKRFHTIMCHILCRYLKPFNSLNNVAISFIILIKRRIFYGSKSISIKEIAKMANVSVATVSRVINNNGRFSKETKEKVEALIKEHGYTTNIAAKSLRTSKSKTIGLIVPNIDNAWFSQLALAIEKQFFDNNYSVFICNTSQDEKKKLHTLNH